jgi:hypothetical protein
MEQTLQIGGNAISVAYPYSGATSLSTAVLTAAGSANTKGGTVSLLDPTPSGIVGVYVTISESNGTGRDFMVDLCIEPTGGGTITVIVPAMLYSVGSDDGIFAYYWPIVIPEGVRLSARCGSSTANSTCHVSAHLIRGSGWQGGPYGRVTAYGAEDGSASSGGVTAAGNATANTRTRTTVVTATANPIRAMVMAYGNNRDSTLTNPTNWLFDIEISPTGAGTWTTLFEALLLKGGSGSDNRHPTTMGPFPVNLQAGIDIAVNQQCSVNAAGDRDFDIVLYGLD